MSNGLLVLTGVLMVGVVSAWGRDGHCIVADIAQDLLSPMTRDSVLKILGDEGNMSDVANWADKVTHTPEFRWTAPLHFTNVQDDSHGCVNEKTKCTYDYKRDCQDTHGNIGFCNAGAIANYTRILTTNLHAGVYDNSTREALKFIIHFTGDIHQPLHCGLAGDRGGVKVDVNFPVNDQGDNWNLHNVWDFGLIVNKEGIEGERFGLIKDIENLLANKWKDNSTQWKMLTDPNSWVQDSLNQAIQYAYRYPNGTLIPLQQKEELYLGNTLDSYMSTGGIIEEQLAKGAVRLATLLRKILG